MLRSWGVGIALCVAPAALRAEPTHAVIHGRVVDGRGAPVPGATVSVTYLYSYDYSQRIALCWLPILPVAGVRVAW
jgi:hypothetical protein